MFKRILLGIIFISILISAFSADLSIIEEAFNNALSETPSAYEYNEESGALFFVQRKNYEFEIIDNGRSPKRLVTYSSTQNQQMAAEDPRPPIREGDCTEFCMKRLLCEADLFSLKAGLRNIQGKRKQSAVRDIM
jgi:hypothetical protein